MDKLDAKLDEKVERIQELSLISLLRQHQRFLWKSLTRFKRLLVIVLQVWP